MKIQKTGIALAFGLVAGIAGHAEAAQRKCYTSEISNRPNVEVAIDAATGHVLSGVNENMPVYHASLTKRMTLLLVLDAIRDGKFSVTDEYGNPTKILLPTAKFRNADNQTQDFDPIDWQYKSIGVYDAITAMILRSSNRAPLGLAIAVAGSEEKFVDMMNAKARELGLTHTHFVNSTGYPTKESLAHHRTTAREHAEVVRVLFRDHPEAMKKLGISRAELTGYLSDGTAKKFKVGTTVQLMPGHKSKLSLSNLLGGKSGTACVTSMLDAEAEIDGRNVITVVAGNDRNQKAYNILAKPTQEILARLRESEGIEIARDMVRSAQEYWNNLVPEKPKLISLTPQFSNISLKVDDGLCGGRKASLLPTKDKRPDGDDPLFPAMLAIRQEYHDENDLRPGIC